MLIELTEYFIPEKILHRNIQIQKIESVFINFKKQGIGSNLLIMGVSGSGKTTVIKKIIEEQDNNVFGSGSITRTSFRTLRAMFDLNCNTNERLLTDIINRLKIKPSIIIIDEVNKIVDKENLFNDLNTIYRETGCPIIIITNKRTIHEDMPEDARLTLFFERVDFPAYNSLELYDIIKQRLDLLKEKIPQVPESTLRKICAIAGRDSSARTVLSITLKCVLANNFSEEYIDETLKNMQQEDWKNFIVNLKPSEKDFLLNLLDLQIKEKQMKPSELSKYMKDFSPSRISQLISAFENYGIIESEYKNLGRAGGRARLIKFVSEDVFFALDELLSK